MVTILSLSSHIVVAVQHSTVTTLPLATPPADINGEYTEAVQSQNSDCALVGVLLCSVSLQHLISTGNVAEI